MRAKKRYVLLKNYPRQMPPNSKFLFQNERGFVIKTDLKGAADLRKEAILISGSVWKLKQPKLLYRKTEKKQSG